MYIGIKSSLQLENKQQIMQNNVETQHKHILVVCVQCNKAFSMERFTCIMTSQLGIREEA